MLRHRGRSRSKQRSSQGDRRSTECSSGLVEDVAVDRVAIVQWDDVQAIKIPKPHDVGMHWFNFITTLTLTLTRRASQHGHLCARRGVRGGVLGLWQGLSTLSPTLLVMTFYDNRQLSDKAPGRFLYFS